MNGFQLPRIEFRTIIPGLPPIPWLVFEVFSIKDHEIADITNIPINYIDNYTIEIDGSIKETQRIGENYAVWMDLIAKYPTILKIRVLDEQNNVLFESEDKFAPKDKTFGLRSTFAPELNRIILFGHIELQLNAINVRTQTQPPPVHIKVTDEGKSWNVSGNPYKLQIEQISPR